MRMILLFVMALLLAPLSAEAQGRGAVFDPNGCNPLSCSESGWIADDSNSNHTTTWRHDLGATPRAVSILFSPDPNQRRVYPLMWPWQWQTTGNPTSIEMGRRAVRLHISAGPPLHGVWRPEGGWQSWREGYWKIIVYR